MANKKISELTALTTLDAADLFVVVDTSTGETKKITHNTLVASIVLGANEITGEVVAGSGTTFTLANAPYSNTPKIYAYGQRLKLTEDYTITVGGIITTVQSWPSGALVADYVYV